MGRIPSPLLLLLCALCGCSAGGRRLVAEQGRLDLSSVDFGRDEVVHLDGQWEFFWSRLLAPGDLERAAGRTGYFALPGFWNGHTVDGRALGGDGYATFRLRVRLPSGGPALALRIEDQSTAYRLWVNGVEVLANGVVGTDPAAVTPYYRIGTAALPGGAPGLDCVLQVSNFHSGQGGPYRKIALGTPAAIERLHVHRLAIDLLLFGALGVIGLLHLVFFVLRPRDRSPLYFAGFCLCWSVGTAFGGTGGRFATLLFPEIFWYWLCRTDILLWFLSVPLLIMFFRSLYPEEIPVRFLRFVQATTAPCFLYVLSAPSRSIDLAVVPFQIFSLAVALAACGLLARAVRRRRMAAVLILSGHAVFVATVVNDILFMNLIIYSVYLISAGIVVMIACQSIALSQRFARSFASVEALSTELAEKNVALSRVDNLKDQFLANTSHELRTPLNGIIGIADSLLAGVTGQLPDETRHNLAMIAASGRRLGALINDILDSSRLRNRDIRLRREPVDLHALAETVLAVMQPLAQGKPIALYNEIPGDTPPALGDEDRLQQVLYNLVGNAIKFTDRGIIRIAARPVDGRIELAISDTGIGIPEDRREAVFQPFEQADASDARAHGGAGLGLSITRQLVELHGGAIDVQSAPGAGSTFRVTLPAAPSQAEGTPRPSAVASTIPALRPAAPVAAVSPTAELPGIEAPATILAVDDDPVNLQVVSNFLAHHNVSVRTAASGQEALAIVESGPPPDLVLLDVMMPRLTGYEVCRRLRQSYSSSVLPVILLTAKTGSQDLVLGFAEGANDYLTKPFSRDELVARVVSQLRLKRSYLTLRENLSLRRELEERKASERELRVVQRRLSTILDSIDEALLAVNESEEIAFCNRPCEALLGYGAEALLGRPLGELLRESAAEISPVKRCLDGASNQELGLVTLARSDGTDCRVRVYLSRFEVEDEPVCLLIIRDLAQSQNGPAARGVPQGLAVVEAIDRNRAQLRSIQGSLNGLLPLVEQGHPGFLEELKTIDEALESVGQTLLQGDTHASRRHLGVEVMTCALDYWTQCTGLTKVDLANQSKQWRTYTNRDGWERTQTLDRYLDIETFPLRPTWAKIMKTAEFVLATGTGDSVLRSRLEILLARLRVSR